MSQIILTKFSLKVQLECLSKKCCPEQIVGKGHQWWYEYNIDWVLGKGCRPQCFSIHDGNNCCYSSELYLSKDFDEQIKCPQCGQKSQVQLV